MLHAKSSIKEGSLCHLTRIKPTRVAINPAMTVATKGAMVVEPLRFELERRIRELLGARLMLLFGKRPVLIN